MKAYAMLHCPFREVLLLDADNVPLVDPEFLFETRAYKRCGAIFWPDLGRFSKRARIWEICGIEYRDEPECETGQIVLDKKVCWRPLLLAASYNEHSDFFLPTYSRGQRHVPPGFSQAGQELAMGPGARGWSDQSRMNELNQKMPAIQPLAHEWNCTPSVNPCRHPFIQAWHGIGPHALELMRGTLADCRRK